MQFAIMKSNTYIAWIWFCLLAYAVNGFSLAKLLVIRLWKMLILSFVTLQRKLRAISLQGRVVFCIHLYCSLGLFLTSNQYFTQLNTIWCELSNCLNGDLVYFIELWLLWICFNWTKFSLFYCEKWMEELNKWIQNLESHYIIWFWLRYCFHYFIKFWMNSAWLSP